MKTYKQQIRKQEMKIYTVDFEEIIKKFHPYVEQMRELDKFKSDHYTDIDNIKKEMDKIISASKSGLILDESMKQQYTVKFRELQVEGSSKENLFRTEAAEMQSRIMEDNFNEISLIIDEYCKSRKIDMVVSRSQVVFVDKAYDLTEYINDIILEKGLAV